MTSYNGVTWRVNYGEVSEREQFRVGRLSLESYDAYFPLSQLQDLIDTLNAVTPLGLSVIARGSQVQAVKVSDGLLASVVISPRLDTGTPVESMRLPLSELTDLLYALSLFRSDTSALPDDWDFSKPVPIKEDLLPAYLRPDGLNATMGEQASTPGTPLETALTAKIAEVKSLKDFMRPPVYARGVVLTQTDDIASFIPSPGSVLWDAPQIGYPAGVPVAVTPATPYAPGCRLLSTGGTNPQSLPFAFYASGKIAVHLTLWADTDIWVSVDGKPVSADPLIVKLSTTGTGQPFVTIALADDQPGLHRYDITLGWGANLVQVVIEPGALMTPGEPAPFTVALTGDSYTDSGIQPYYSGPAQTLRHFTGWNVIPLGQGSTGYTNDGHSSGNTSKQVYGGTARVAALKASNPDAAIVVGSVNDGSATPAQVKSAALAYYADLAPISVVVVGVEPLYNAGGPTFAAWDAINTALREAASEAPNVIGFIDWWTEDWLTGTGSQSNLQYDGNQDWAIGDQAGTDTIHPSHAGWKLLLIPRLVAALAPLSIAA